jgi:ABC-type amino acid transport substrate-binding protein
LTLRCRTSPLFGGIIVRDDENRIHSVRDLAGRRVAVMEGDNAEEYLRRRETEFDLTLFPTFREAIDAVAAGDADAVVMQRLVALRLLRDTGIGGVRLVGDPIADFRQDFCFAVPRGRGSSWRFSTRDWPSSSPTERSGGCRPSGSRRWTCRAGGF